MIQLQRNRMQELLQQRWHQENRGQYHAAVSYSWNQQLGLRTSTPLNLWEDHALALGIESLVACSNLIDRLAVFIN